MASIIKTSFISSNGYIEGANKLNNLVGTSTHLSHIFPIESFTGRKVTLAAQPIKSTPEQFTLTLNFQSQDIKLSQHTNGEAFFSPAQYDRSTLDDGTHLFTQKEPATIKLKFSVDKYPNKLTSTLGADRRYTTDLILEATTTSKASVDETSKTLCEELKIDFTKAYEASHAQVVGSSGFKW